MTITITKRRAVAVAAALLLLLWWSGSAASPIPSPFAPRPDRPVLRAIARLAKNFLWVALLAEGPPAEAVDHQAVRTRVGDDGHRILEHGRGW